MELKNMATPQSGVTVEARDGRHHLMLSRPSKGNALSADMVTSFCEAFDRCIEAGARLIVLEGQGRHFCTGFDLSTLEIETDASLLLRFVNIEKLLQKVHSSPVMTVAIGRGRCSGAGADLFASCDRRIAVKGASFAFPGLAFGIVLGTARLANRIGRDRTRQILLAGSVLADQAALERNLATELVGEDEIGHLLATLTADAHRLDATTVNNLHAATDGATYDRDLSDLVRSASRPGLRDRIIQYQANLKPQRHGERPLAATF
jgi:enoyl-CoA hydratase/carnithine racemase